MDISELVGDNRCMQAITFKTPIKEISITATDKGLVSLSFGKAPKTKSVDSKAQIHLDQAKKQIEEYFNGKRTTFDLKLAPAGTEFQLKVWSSLSKIPFGKTLSYADIANMSGSPKAFRAVGSANGKNPLPIIVPCHRVINADGKLGGYSGGLDIKEKLLELEGVIKS